MAWTELGLATGVFLVSHTIPVRPPVKPWLVARLGARGFTLAYSVLSLAILAWLVGAVGRAPFVPIWSPHPVLTATAMAAMLAACLLLCLAIGAPNPFSFGGGDPALYAPDAPGIVRWTRHPLLLVLTLWAGAHLLANGDLAHAGLFALFALFAVLGMGILDARRRREMGADWSALEARRQAAPALPRLTAAAVLRLALGGLLWWGLLQLHGPLLGVTPQL